MDQLVRLGVMLRGVCEGYQHDAALARTAMNYMMIPVNIDHFRVVTHALGRINAVYDRYVAERTRRLRAMSVAELLTQHWIAALEFSLAGGAAERERDHLRYVRDMYADHARVLGNDSIAAVAGWEQRIVGVLPQGMNLDLPSLSIVFGTLDQWTTWVNVSYREDNVNLSPPHGREEARRMVARINTVVESVRGFIMAFAMGSHPRLGAGSVVGILNAEVLRIVLEQGFIRAPETEALAGAGPAGA